jgi:hypothetical protein
VLEVAAVIWIIHSAAQAGIRSKVKNGAASVDRGYSDRLYTAAASCLDEHTWPVPASRSLGHSEVGRMNYKSVARVPCRVHIVSLISCFGTRWKIHLTCYIEYAWFSGQDTWDEGTGKDKVTGVSHVTGHRST